MKARFYFDVVSPFAYLMVEQLHRLPESLTVAYRPLLLAALLDHWGHKGPAEIPAKRRFTYRRVLWTAHTLGIPLRFPPNHPFNPLPLLRLAILLGDDPSRVRELFRSVWREGELPDSPDALDALGERLGVSGASKAIQRNDVKQKLRENSERAIENQVFGVPTLIVNGELFWGADSLDMLLDYLRAPERFSEKEFRRIDELPIGAMRRMN